MTDWKKITVPLAHHLTIGEGPAAKTYSAITFSEPDLEALEKLEEAGILDGEKMGIRQIRVAIETLADLPKEAVPRIHASDVLKCAEALGPLLESLVPEGSPPTP